MKIVSVGEILWDVFDATEHLGGAPFNFAAHSRLLGHEVRFVSAVGDDDRGRRALARMRDLGLSTAFVSIAQGSATGTVTVSIDAAGQPAFTIHRPAAYDRVVTDAGDLERIRAFEPDWIYYGTLFQAASHSRRITQALIGAARNAKRFYDVNLRPASYTPELVLELLRIADVVKLNDSEVGVIAGIGQCDCATLQDFCETASARFGWHAVCVTRGDKGCAVFIEGVYAEAPGYKVKVADTVGAGDAFAAAFLHGLQQGWSPREVGDFANRLGAIVASRQGAIPAWTLDECYALAATKTGSPGLPV